MESRKKGIIFDMDGTLIDSMEGWRHIGSLCLAYCGGDAEAAGPDFDHRIYGMQEEEVVREFAKYGIRFSGRRDFVETYYKAIRPYYETVKPMPGIMEVLEKGRAAGLSMCVATATRRDLAVPVLERLGIMPYMEFLLCCDDVGASKTRPDIYLESARRLGLPLAETVVFEDAAYCIRTLKAAGFTAVGIYDPTADPEESEEVRRLSDLFLQDYGQLLNMF